jgi:hypothetical protein
VIFVEDKVPELSAASMCRKMVEENTITTFEAKVLEVLDDS